MKSDDESVLSARDIGVRPRTSDRSSQRPASGGAVRDVSPDGRIIAAYGNGRGQIDHVVARPGRWRGASRTAARVSAEKEIIGSLVKWSMDGKSILIAKEKGDDSPSESGA